MPVNRLKEFLEANHVRFVTISHSPAFTAQEIAAVAHVPGREMAKTVMVKLDGRLAMVVLPAPDRVSPERLREVTGAKDVELASEQDFQEIFPNCELGAMPPFGNLWDLPVFVDVSLREDDEICFNAGNHTELMRLSYADFERLVEPTIGRLGSLN